MLGSTKSKITRKPTIGTMGSKVDDVLDGWATQTQNRERGTATVPEKWSCSTKSFTTICYRNSILPFNGLDLPEFDTSLPCNVQRGWKRRVAICSGCTATFSHLMPHAKPYEPNLRANVRITRWLGRSTLNVPIGPSFSICRCSVRILRTRRESSQPT